MNRGLLAAAGAYFIWGLWPLYWRLLEQVPTLQIMAHRAIWCAAFVLAYLFLRYRLVWLQPLRASPRVLGLLAVSGLLIGGNWWLYIWAVNAGHVVETSLGYFINPLVSVALGVVVLSERLNPRQWFAVAIAAAGVAYLTVKFGQPPWIALGLALSFAAYGLLRKIAHVGAIPGLAVECSFLLLPAIAILLTTGTHSGLFGEYSPLTIGLLIAAGPTTALPLVWFAYGARRVPLSMMGILQYIAPSLQLLCAVLIFNEPFTHTHLIGFACIWAALAIYAADGMYRLRYRTSTILPVADQ
ncbi:MAG: EamA family transporter RarD [Nevskiales bacterium]